MQSKDENALSILETVLANLKIPCCELFWDENLMGKKPKQFAVYSFDFDGTVCLATADDGEILLDEITVSFYLKQDIRNRLEFRNLKKSCKKALHAAGFYISDGYETYEKDTGLKRFDLQLNYYYNESED